jgi:hypothetical protein
MLMEKAIADPAIRAAAPRKTRNESLMVDGETKYVYVCDRPMRGTIPKKFVT